MCGNGEVADASILPQNLSAAQGTSGINAEALTVNTSTLTAIGNDYSYERVFARQPKQKLPGDIVIGITTSGTSRMYWRHFVCKENGMVTVFLMGGLKIRTE